MARYKKVVIGIDQSYQDTGISIACDGKLKKLSHVTFLPDDCKTVKRQKVQEVLERAISANIGKCDKMVVIVERIRTFSGGNLSLDYIKSTGALIGAICDTAYKYGVKVYSVDTRSWKSKVVGDSKPAANKYYVDPNKWPTIRYLCKKGYELDILEPVSNRCKNYAKLIEGVKYKYNDNIADSACIALYGFKKGRILNKEE